MSFQPPDPEYLVCVKHDNAFPLDEGCEDCREDAIAKPEEKEIDCLGTDEIVCPHCGHEHGDSWEYFTHGNGNEREADCVECEKRFLVSAEYSVTYFSSKKP